MKTAISFFFVFLISYTAGFTQDVYQLDQAHTFINFSVERFMVGEVVGKFNRVEGSFNFNSDSNQISTIEVSIQANSLDTDHNERDGHLKGKTWLDVESYPVIEFKSTKVKKVNTQWIAYGKLSIHGVTNEVELPFEMKGPFLDPTRKMTIGLSGVLIINRKDYGITFNKLMDNGELFIGEEVKINIKSLSQKL